MKTIYWFLQLQCLAKVKVPRCLQTQQSGKSKEVVTSDAPQQVYGVVSYLIKGGRWKDGLHGNQWSDDSSLKE